MAIPSECKTNIAKVVNKMKYEVMNSSLAVKSGRNYGIDLLRFISMVFVVIIHLFEHGGILQQLTEGTTYVIGWSFFIIVNCAVDIYIIISGYVTYREQQETVDYSSYTKLWLQVVFYSCLAYFIGIWGGKTFSLIEFVKCFFPVTTDQYWFFTKYSMMFFIMPVINRFAKYSTDKELTTVTIVGIAAFSIYCTAVSPAYNAFDISSGYSFIWFVVLYIVGVWMKKCKIPYRINNRKLTLILISSYLIPVLMKTFVAGATYSLFGQSMGEDILISYTAPTTVAVSVAYVSIFSKLKLGNNQIRIIKALTPATFATYLLHDNRIVRYLFIFNRFSWVAMLEWYKMIGVIFGVTTIIVALGIVTETTRITISNVFHGCLLGKLTVLISRKEKI